MSEWQPSARTDQPISLPLVRYIMRDIRRTGLVMKSDEPELRVALECLAREKKDKE